MSSYTGWAEAALLFKKVCYCSVFTINSKGQHNLLAALNSFQSTALSWRHQYSARAERSRNTSLLGQQIYRTKSNEYSCCRRRQVYTLGLCSLPGVLPSSGFLQIQFSSGQPCYVLAHAQCRQQDSPPGDESKEAATFCKLQCLYIVDPKGGRFAA